MKIHKLNADEIGTRCSECGQDSDVLIEIGRDEKDHEREIVWLCPACIKRAFELIEG